MKLIKLWANNFRTIKGHQELSLTDTTINLFVGETNGVGKSSWFFLFYYLVTGYINGKTQDEYVNWDSTEMSGGTEFEYKSHAFKIEAYYKCGTDGKSGKADKTLWIDGEQFDGVTGCNKKLKEYFEPNLFLNATGLLQDSGNVVLIKDSERRDNLKKVFNLDYSEDIKELEKEEKLVDSQELAPKQTLLIELRSKTFEQQQLLEQPISEEQYTLAKNTLDISVAELAKVDIEINSINTKEKEKQNKELQLKAKQTQLERENLILKQLQTTVQFCNDFRQDFSKLEKYKLDLSQIRFERLKAFDETSLNEKLQKIANNNADKRTTLKIIQDCKDGKCPTCGEAFSSSKHNQYQLEVDEIDTLNKELQNEVDILKKEKNLYEEAVKQNESKKRDKELLDSRIESEQQRLDNELKLNCEKLEKAKSDIVLKEASIESLINEIKLITNEINLIVIESIDDLLQKRKDLESLISERNAIISSYESVKIKNELIEKQNKQLEIDRLNNEKLIVETQKLVDELVEKKQQLTKMRFFLKNEFPSYVISTMITSIQDTMNEFISKVYYKDLDVVIDGSDDTIAILYGTGRRKVDVTNASGAEKALLAISYCYALNKFKDYGILFLDETDSELKENLSIELAEMITIMSIEYEFVGIVSHISAVQDFYYAKGANIIEVDK